MLGQPLRPGRTVFHRDDRHAQGIEVASGRRHFEAVRVVAHIGTAGIDDLDGIGRPVFGNVPFQIGGTLFFLKIGYPVLRPDVFLVTGYRDQVFGEAVRQCYFRLRFAQETHLGHEFDAALKAEGAVPFPRVEMQFGRYAHFP